LELGLHVPLTEFGSEGQSLSRLTGAVDAARENGFAAVSANDHFLFQTPWLDGATALAAVIDHPALWSWRQRSRTSRCAVLCPSRRRSPRWMSCPMGGLFAGVGAGSSERDYDAVGVPFEKRWERFDEAIAISPPLSG
jgi:alkanesulfonate monooxygenase SsuD/methylene tetrahydromethanopterin reductase-like flavin-dependent oxidoreductase (luciferase family)